MNSLLNFYAIHLGQRKYLILFPIKKKPYIITTEFFSELFYYNITEKKTLDSKIIKMNTIGPSTIKRSQHMPVRGWRRGKKKC